MALIVTHVCLPLAAVLVIAGCSGDDDVEFRPGCVTSSDCAAAESCDPVSGACVVADPPQPIEPAPTDASDSEPDMSADAGAAPDATAPPSCEPLAGDERDDDCKGEGKGKKDKDKDNGKGKGKGKQGDDEDEDD